MDAAHQLLRQWSETYDEKKSAELLAQLVTEHAAPAIRPIVSSRLGSHSADLDDVVQAALCSLIEALITMKKDGTGLNKITSFIGYATTVAVHGSNGHYRAESPAWSRIATRLRYALKKPDLAQWSFYSFTVCGFAWMRGSEPGEVSTEDAAVNSAVRQTATSESQFGQAVREMFRSAGRPLIFGTAVNILKKHFGLQLRTRVAGHTEEEDTRLWEKIADQAITAEEHLLNVEWVQSFWAAVKKLALLEKRAFLLNPDGRHNTDVTVLVYSGVASIAEIAGELQMSDGKLCEVWPRLPLDDAGIADLFDMTQAQVIGQRYRAKAKLRELLNPANEQI